MKLCRQPSDFFHWRSHLQTLMRSERVVQVDGFLCKAPDLLQTFVFCTEEPSVLERIVHPLARALCNGSPVCVILICIPRDLSLSTTHCSSIVRRGRSGV